MENIKQIIILDHASDNAEVVVTSFDANVWESPEDFIDYLHKEGELSLGSSNCSYMTSENSINIKSVNYARG